MVDRFTSWLERMVYTDAQFSAQSKATRALVKFCADHRYHECPQYLDSINACLEALERCEKSSALEHYQKVWLGLNGFADWWPPVVFAHEDQEYVKAEFDAVIERWWRLMESLAGQNLNLVGDRKV